MSCQSARMWRTVPAVVTDEGWTGCSWIASGKGREETVQDRAESGPGRAAMSRLLHGDWDITLGQHQHCGLQGLAELARTGCCMVESLGLRALRPVAPHWETGMLQLELLHGLRSTAAVRERLWVCRRCAAGGQRRRSRLADSPGAAAGPGPLPRRLGLRRDCSGLTNPRHPLGGCSMPALTPSFCTRRRDPRPPGRRGRIDRAEAGSAPEADAGSYRRPACWPTCGPSIPATHYRCGRMPHFAGHGSRAWPVPAELAACSSPRIGFVGATASYS